MTRRGFLETVALFDFFAISFELKLRRNQTNEILIIIFF